MAKRYSMCVDAEGMAQVVRHLNEGVGLLAYGDGISLQVHHMTPSKGHTIPKPYVIHLNKHQYSYLVTKMVDENLLRTYKAEEY